MEAAMRSSASLTGAPSPFSKEKRMKKSYRRPALRRLGLLRQVTRFSF
jgi:hypothetical protein